jgi:tetratricopeptide (TPR) repeat protein
MGWLDKLLGREKAESPFAGEAAAAKKAVEQARSDFPAEPEPEPEPELSDAEKAVDDLIERGKPQEAMARCEEELRKAPGHPGLLKLKAECCVELRLPDEKLLAALDEVCAADAKDWSARGHRGHVLLRLARPEEARLAFAAALKAKETALGWANMAAALAALGKGGEAEQAARKAVGLMPKESWVGRMSTAAALLRVPGLPPAALEGIAPIDLEQGRSLNAKLPKP